MTKTLKVNSIPEVLTSAPQWVLWKYEERGGKQTKPPFQPNGHYASHADPATWSRFEAVMAAYKSGEWEGIGFVLSDQDPIGGIDLDHCIDPDTGEIAEWARSYVERMDSYTEMSPSGTGLRIFLRGSLPDHAPRGGKKLTGLGADGAGAIEMYCRLRYLTVTGRHLKDTPREIRERTDEFQALFNELWPNIPRERPASTHAAPPLAMDDSELLSKMFGSRTGPEILRLWNGDLSGHNGDHSAADLALCNYLAWWTNGDEERIDRLFRQSRLYRDKWDDKRGDGTYGQMTVGLALAELKEGYSGPSTPFDVDADTERAARDPGTERDLAAARKTAETLPEKLRQDPGWPFRGEGLQVLGLLRALDKAAWQHCKVALRNARISIREVERELPSVGAFLPKPPDDRKRGTYAADTLDNSPAPTLLIPTPYYVDEGVTGRMIADEHGALKQQSITDAPILIIGRTRDVATGAESLLLAWKWPRSSGWHHRIVDRGAAFNGRELAKLAGWGFPVADDCTRELITYLRKLEAANRPELPCAKVSTHLGWQGEPGQTPFLCGRVLILPDGAVQAVDALDVEHPEGWAEERICFHGAGEGQEQIVDAFHPRGSLKTWLEAVSVLQDHPKALAVFYAGLAPPLLAIFGVPNFVLDLAHDTTIGKTTALRGAASHWGNPDERTACSVVLTWDASRVGIERTSEVISHLPLCVDDTKKAKHPKMVADLIYAVTSGRGRMRGTLKGIAHTPVWRTIMFSTGEQPATSFTQDGGTRTRVLQLGGYPFGEQSAELGRKVDRLNAQLFANFGHSGPQFMAWLLRNRESWPEWKARYDGLVDKYATDAGNPESGRLAPYAALISITGEMAHRALGLPWEFIDPMRGLWSELAAGAADAAGSVRALDDILSWASSHEHMFLGRVPSNGFVERTPPAVYGRWDDEPWKYLAVYPTVLRETLARFGYSPDAILRSWRERGWLRCTGGKLTGNVNTGSNEVRKMVIIERHAFEQLECSA